jgi:hypothetical protein
VDRRLVGRRLIGRLLVGRLRGDRWWTRLPDGT